ncbi:MAG: UDP-galactopyranose mutase [Casimicrobiaceae bacterium]
MLRFEFLSRFTTWHACEHRVLAKVRDLLLPIPINRTTINALCGLALDEAGVAAHLANVCELRSEARTSEDVVLGGVGRDLCEKFFRGCSRKQWGLDLSEPAPAVAARIPVRTNDDDRYQCMPAHGYTAMFERMLDHPLLTFATGVDGVDACARIGARHAIHTGTIDAWYAYRYGRRTRRCISAIARSPTRSRT